MLTETNKKTSSNSIPIPINKNQYSLKQSFFDPTKNSPPNYFMIKLYNRMIKYENHSMQNNVIFDKK